MTAIDTLFKVINILPLPNKQHFIRSGTIVPW